ncbi:MAG: hypothetical protein V3W20_11625, partial [Candidatus Neomarinimicrobiota bacterium]
MNTIPLNFVRSGNQIQTDIAGTNLSLSCDPQLVIPEQNNGVSNPVFKKNQDGKSAIAVDICCLETPCD